MGKTHFVREIEIKPYKYDKWTYDTDIKWRWGRFYIYEKSALYTCILWGFILSLIKLYLMNISTKTLSFFNKGRHCGIESLYRHTYRHIVMFNPLNERLSFFTSSFAIVSWLFSYFANMHICWMFKWVHQSLFYPAKQFQADTIGLMWQFKLR